MGLIAPAGKPAIKEVKKDKGTLSSALAVKINDTFMDDSGTMRTVAQGIAERLINIALTGDDKDAVSASKVIFDRLVGRAPIQKEETKIEMPKIVFALSDDEVSRIEKSSNSPSEAESDNAVVRAVTEDGMEYEF